MLTQQRLREVLNYDPDSGEFTWRPEAIHFKSRRQYKLSAGYVDGHGYVMIYIEGEKFNGQRIAWLYMTGHWPDMDIDHIDGDRANNRWNNLQAVTMAQNIQKAKKRVDNKSGYRGVYWNKRQQAWHARVTKNQQVYHCGYFNTLEEAKTARDLKASELHGAFARFDDLVPPPQTKGMN